MSFLHIAEICQGLYQNLDTSGFVSFEKIKFCLGNSKYCIKHQCVVSVCITIFKKEVLQKQRSFKPQ